MYKVLIGGAQDSFQWPVRRMPYIAVGNCIAAARRAKECLQPELVDAGPFPLAELVRAMGVPLEHREIATSEQRWFLAHDLGHLVLQHPNAPLWYLDCEADVFARELLIPADSVLPLHRTQSLRAVARMFGVPLLKAEWALSEYNDHKGTFKCPVFTESLECASLSRIAECKASGKAFPECARAALTDLGKGVENRLSDAARIVIYA